MDIFNLINQNSLWIALCIIALYFAWAYQKPIERRLNKWKDVMDKKRTNTKSSTNTTESTTKKAE